MQPDRICHTHTHTRTHTHTHMCNRGGGWGMADIHVYY